MLHALTCVVVAVAVQLASAPVRAQSGGSYNLRWNTIDGGSASGAVAPYRLGGTSGQPDAGRLSGGAYTVAGGFWGGIAGPMTPAPTDTPLLGTPTATMSNAATPTRTVPPMQTVSPSPTRSRTGGVTATPKATPTPTTSTGVSPTPTFTPTRTPPVPCTGDCNRDGRVTVTDILKMVNIALGDAPFSDCTEGDANDDERITVTDIITAVTNALGACGQGR
jgi:hypothetical protein